MRNDAHLLLHHFYYIEVHCQGEFYYVRQVGYLKIEIGPTRTRKFLIKIWSFTIYGSTELL